MDQIAFLIFAIIFVAVAVFMVKRWRAEHPASGGDRAPADEK